MPHILDKNYFRYNGRILMKEDTAFLGFTNSSIEFYVKRDGDCDSSKETLVTAQISSNSEIEVNQARLKVYVDGELAPIEPIVLDAPYKTYPIVTLNDGNPHRITIIKVTEAQMSYAQFHAIKVDNGSILPLPAQPDTRLKAEFIGDSITCGYGVLGEPHSEFHIREEDGELSYAALTSKELNLNARYTGVSGYGVYCEYTGNTKGTLPYVYPYTNYWVDQETLYDFHEFTPELVVLNLGTNDSRFLGDPSIQEKFIICYMDFLKLIRSKYPDAKLLCICGTLCTEAFPLIQKACDYLTDHGFKELYTLELPYHNVEEDGQASEHPSLKTHQKDAARLIKKIKEIIPALQQKET